MARKVYLIPVHQVVGEPNPPERNKLARYRRALRRGAKFPPIDMAKRSKHWGGGYDIIDGSNRFHAHRLEGYFFVPAYLQCDRFPSPYALEYIPRSYAADFCRGSV
jgi:hypothetical protein